MEKEIKFKIYLQNEKTGEIFSVVFDYAQIFSGIAKLQCAAYWEPCKVIGKSEFTGLPVVNESGVEEEMYQGDILLVDDDVIGFVDWEYNRWVVRVKLHCRFKEIGSWSDWVKLGNIYQNPELVAAQ